MLTREKMHCLYIYFNCMFSETLPCAHQYDMLAYTQGQTLRHSHVLTQDSVNTVVGVNYMDAGESAKCLNHTEYATLTINVC